VGEGEGVPGWVRGKGQVNCEWGGTESIGESERVRVKMGGGQDGGGRWGFVIVSGGEVVSACQFKARVAMRARARVR